MKQPTNQGTNEKTCVSQRSHNRTHVHGAKRNENAYSTIYDLNESISHESSYNESGPVFLPGFHALGSTGPTEKLKGGHEGEKWVMIFRYS